MIATMAFATLAGILSTLSPCVLPILPIVIGSATAEHRFGLAALAAGLALSFAALGIFVATLGAAIGLDADLFREVGAVVLVVLGLVLMIPRLQIVLAVATGPFGGWMERRFGGSATGGWPGQFGVGLLLGFVWSPCAGPTLGAASIAAASTAEIVPVASTMMAFGVGAALPLLALGALSRRVMLLWRDRLRSAAAIAKPIMGTALVALGCLTLAGLDKSIEATLVDLSPDWLTTLTTKF